MENGYAGVIYTPVSKFNVGLYNQFTSRRYNSLADHDKEFRLSEIRNNTELSLTWRISKGVSINGGCLLLTLSEHDNDVSGRTRVTPMPYLNFFAQLPHGFSVSGRTYQNISYPVLDNLNPAIYHIDQYMILQGNPYLKPEKFTYVNGVLSYKKLIKLEYLYRFNRNQITDYYSVIDNNMVNKTYINSNYVSHYVSLGSEYEFFNCFSYRVLLSMTWYKRNAEQMMSKNGKTYYVDLDFNYACVPINTIFSLNIFCRDDRFPLLQGEKMVCEQLVMIGAQRNFFKNHFSVGLSYAVPVHFLNPVDTQFISVQGYNNKHINHSSIKESVFRLLLKFNIGNGKVKSSRASLRLEKEKN